MSTIIGYGKVGLEIHTGINFTEEGSLTDFKIPGLGVTHPAGTFNNSEAQIVFITNPSKKLYLSTRSVMGGYFSDQNHHKVVRSGSGLATDSILNILITTMTSTCWRNSI